MLLACLSQPDNPYKVQASPVLTAYQAASTCLLLCLLYTHVYLLFNGMFVFLRGQSRVWLQGLDSFQPGTDTLRSCSLYLLTNHSLCCRFKMTAYSFPPAPLTTALLLKNQTFSALGPNWALTLLETITVKIVLFILLTHSAPINMITYLSLTDAFAGG